MPALVEWFGSVPAGRGFGYVDHVIDSLGAVLTVLVYAVGMAVHAVLPMLCAGAEPDLWAHLNAHLDTARGETAVGIRKAHRSREVQRRDPPQLGADVVPEDDHRRE